jgi:hypothetical protein
LPDNPTWVRIQTLKNHVDGTLFAIFGVLALAATACSIPCHGSSARRIIHWLQSPCCLKYQPRPRHEC